MNFGRELSPHIGTHRRAIHHSTKRQNDGDSRRHGSRRPTATRRGIAIGYFNQINECYGVDEIQGTKEMDRETRNIGHQYQRSGIHHGRMQKNTTKPIKSGRRKHLRREKTRF